MLVYVLIWLRCPSIKDVSMKKIFFPYLDEHDIKQIIHLGDYFDRRKYVNFASMKANIETLY